MTYKYRCIQEVDWYNQCTFRSMCGHCIINKKECDFAEEKKNETK